LTIFFEEGYEDLPQFLAKNKVIVTASLPCYEKNNVDFQRGFGVFEKSINAIKILNDLGYGKKKNGLQLNLVYNPVSPILPPSQEILEEDYKRILFEKYNIVFNNLYTITNMPINRNEESLRREGKLNTYYKLLKENFNEKNLENLMWKKFTKKMKKETIRKGIYQLKHGSYEYPITLQLIKDGRKNKVLNKKINSNIKVTMVHGEKDEAVPVSYSRKVLKLFPKAK